MTDVPEAARDVVSLLTFQHGQILTLFAATVDGSGERRAANFTALRQLVAVHEMTEQEIVHPRARHELEDGQAVVSARLLEEQAIVDMFGDLELLGVSSPSFVEGVRQLQSHIRAHLQAEEGLEFSGLQVQLGVRQLRRMAKAVQLADEVLSAGEATLVEPFAAMLEQARYAISACQQDTDR